MELRSGSRTATPSERNEAKANGEIAGVGEASCSIALGIESDSGRVTPEKPVTNNQGYRSSSSLLYLICIFVTSIIAMACIYLNFPPLQPHESRHVQLPRNIDQAKSLGNVLLRYREAHYYTVLFGMFLTYIFLQSFAIPGSIFLTILFGFLFPFPLALLLTCCCSGIGASICFLLSDMCKSRINKWLRGNLYFDSMCKQVASQHDNLLYYIVFLRITPFLPNWLINIASPILEVPLWTFFIGTFFGVAPPCMMYIQGGRTLNELISETSIFEWKSILFIAVTAAISLLPIAFKERLKRRMIERKEE